MVYHLHAHIRYRCAQGCARRENVHKAEFAGEQTRLTLAHFVPTLR